ncbi:MAG: cytochrome c4 [Burkholderiales bacterium]|nr:cytochrome c4 [Burkholderiales bacterium]
MKLYVPTILALGLAALLSTASANETKPEAKVDPARGAELSATICGACHTNDGSRGVPANPILQGQHPEYLVKQLGEFKSDQRASAIMKGFASMLSDADMKSVAAFYSSKQPAAGAARDKDLVRLGEKIYRGGIADRSIPACAGCHSPTGMGIPAQYPRVAGQHADYTEAQLKAFRDGIRKNSAQMTGVAAKLNDREIKAVADYMAGLN